MSEQQASANVEQTEANAEGNQQQFVDSSVDHTLEQEVLDRDPVKYETHHRVLQESKKNKIKRQELEKKLETIERQQMEEQGRYRELAEKASQELDVYKKRYAVNAIKAELAKHAKGCRDFDLLMKAGSLDMIEFDEDSGSVHGVDQFVQSVRAEKPWMFENNSQSVVNTATPGANVSALPQAKSASQLSGDALNQAMAQTLNKHYKNRS